MADAAAATIAFARIERDHHVAASPTSFAPWINAEADAIAERPDADELVQVPMRCGQASGQNVGVVVHVDRRVDSYVPQGRPNQILHMGALQLAQIGRLLDKTAVDDARQANTDRIHGLPARYRPDLLRKTLRNSLGRQAEQRLVIRPLLIDPEFAGQLVPFHQPSRDVLGGGDAYCSSHVLSCPYQFASLFSPLNAAAL